MLPLVRPSFLLLAHRADLRLNKTVLSHLYASSGLGKLYIRLKAFPGGRSRLGAGARRLDSAKPLRINIDLAGSGEIASDSRHNVQFKLLSNKVLDVLMPSS
jgi:hypothetical protein